MIGKTVKIISSKVPFNFDGKIGVVVQKRLDFGTELFLVEFKGDTYPKICYFSDDCLEVIEAV